jgi:hypothetical protein
MNIQKKLLCTAGAILFLSTTTLFATGQSARDILNHSYQYLGSMDKYAFTAVVSDEVAQDAKAYTHTTLVKVDRPNKLRVEITGTIKNRTNYLNNGSYTMFDHHSKFYGEIKIPKNIDDALDVLFEKFNIKAPLAQLIYSGMDKRAKFAKSKYFGTKVVDGVECDYIAFRNGTKEIHIWIATGDKPLVKVYSIINTSKNYPSRINTSVTWNENAHISDNDFVFVAPKDASKISVNPVN